MKKEFALIYDRQNTVASFNTRIMFVYCLLSYLANIY